jgi:DNA-binding GntR family transcriptional regulator
MRPEEIASSLRRAVRERILSPGQALNQDELARLFGVSRIPLREALRTLAGEGLITIKPGLGAVVSELEPGEVDELYGLRLQIEPPLAPYIVANCRREDIEGLRRTADEMAALRAEETEEWSNLNYQFLRRLCEMAGRRHTNRLVVQLLNLVEPYARVHAHVLHSRAALQERLREMVKALENHDADTLSRLLAEGIETTRRDLLTGMAAAAPPDKPDPLNALRSL